MAACQPDPHGAASPGPLSAPAAALPARLPMEEVSIPQEATKATPPTFLPPLQVPPSHCLPRLLPHPPAYLQRRCHTYRRSPLWSALRLHPPLQAPPGPRLFHWPPALPPSWLLAAGLLSAPPSCLPALPGPAAPHSLGALCCWRYHPLHGGARPSRPSTMTRGA